MQRFEFTLALDAELTQHLYAGRAQAIQVEDRRGLTLRLPAARFRAFVGADGIHGDFVVVVDDARRIVDLRRLGDAPARR